MDGSSPAQSHKMRRTPPCRAARHDEMRSGVALGPNPAALRRVYLRCRQTARGSCREEAEEPLSRPRRVPSFRQNGKNVPIAIHECFPNLDLLLNARIEGG